MPARSCARIRTRNWVTNDHLLYRLYDKFSLTLISCSCIFLLQVSQSLYSPVRQCAACILFSYYEASDQNAPIICLHFLPIDARYRDLRCLRNTIHANLFLTHILSSLLWILTLSLQVSVLELNAHTHSKWCLCVCVWMWCSPLHWLGKSKCARWMCAERKLQKSFSKTFTFVQS